MNPTNVARPRSGILARAIDGRRKWRKGGGWKEDYEEGGRRFGMVEFLGDCVERQCLYTVGKMGRSILGRKLVGPAWCVGIIGGFRNRA